MLSRFSLHNTLNCHTLSYQLPSWNGTLLTYVAFFLFITERQKQRRHSCLREEQENFP